MFDSTRSYKTLSLLNKDSGGLTAHLTETITKTLVRTAELRVSAVIPMEENPNDELGKHYLVEFMKDDQYTSRKLTFASEVEALVEAVLTMNNKQRLELP